MPIAVRSLRTCKSRSGSTFCAESRIALGLGIVHITMLYHSESVVSSEISLAAWDTTQKQPGLIATFAPFQQRFSV